MFSCEFCKISKNTVFIEQNLRVTASEWKVALNDTYYNILQALHILHLWIQIVFWTTIWRHTELRHFSLVSVIILELIP